jgi:hypothetical protein
VTDELSDADQEFLASAKASVRPDDDQLWAQALEFARKKCGEWMADKDAPTAERVGTRERDIAIAKCVATYFADSFVPEAMRTEKAAVSCTIEGVRKRFGVEVSASMVRRAVAKCRHRYQLEGRSNFLVNGFETPFEPDLEAEPALLPAPPAEWSA